MHAEWAARKGWRTRSGAWEGCVRRAMQTNIAGGEATCDLAVCGGREKSTTEVEEVCRRGAVGREDCAFQRGLHLTSAGAERFAAAAEVDEAARLALEEAGYRELQQQLRTRVAPPAVAAGTMPALPGPTAPSRRP